MAKAKKAPSKADLIAVFRQKFAVSYSRIALYEQCPAKFYFKNIAKLEEGPRTALERGIAVHKGGEDFVTGKTKVVPKEYLKFKQEMRELVKRKAVAEQEWAFTRKWEPTGWFDANCWMRVKTDAAYMIGKKAVGIVDYKTGKRYDEKHADSAQLYATSALSIYGTIEKVRVEFFYLDLAKDNKATYEFSRDELLECRVDWQRRAQRIEKDNHFLPLANRFCGYCDFNSANGGPCPL